MADELDGTSTNGTESTSTETTDTSTTPVAEGTTSTTEPSGTTETTETAKEPEFSDPNLQKAWTEKTQRLADERKAWEAQVADFNQRKDSYEKKAALFDRFDSDPEIVAFIRKKYGYDAEPKTDITPDELMEAQTDPAKMVQLIQREAKKLVAPVSEEVGNLKLENAIQAYSDAKGNEDFWELYDAGLIKDKMVALKNTNPNMADLDLIKNSHLEARNIISAIHEQAERKAKEKAAGIVTEKKAAIMDKGGRSTSANGGGKSYKGKSMLEIANDVFPDK